MDRGGHIPCITNSPNRDTATDNFRDTCHLQYWVTNSIWEEMQFMLEEYPNTVANLYPKNQEFIGEGGVGHPVSLSMFLWDTKTLAAGGEAGRVPLVTHLRCW